VSRAETAGSTAKSALENMVPLEVLERVAKELRRHGIRAYIMPDYRGIPDLYIREEDNTLLDKLCDGGQLSREARELLC